MEIKWLSFPCRLVCVFTDQSVHLQTSLPVFGLQTRLTWKDLWANSAKERAWHGTSAMPWRWVVSKHAIGLICMTLCCIFSVWYVCDCVLAMGGVVVASCARSATRSHRPCEVMVPLIVVRWAQGLKLQWWWQGKPPPCMHNFTLVVQREWVCHARKVASQRPSRQ